MTTTACRPLPRVLRQKLLDPADALVRRRGRRGVAAPSQFVGQVGQQLGGGHLREDEVDDRGEGLGRASSAAWLTSSVLPVPDAPASSAPPRRFSMA